MLRILVIIYNNVVIEQEVPLDIKGVGRVHFVLPFALREELEIVVVLHMPPYPG